MKLKNKKCDGSAGRRKGTTYYCYYFLSLPLDNTDMNMKAMSLPRFTAVVLLLLATADVNRSTAVVAASKLSIANNIAFLPRGGGRRGKSITPTQQEPENEIIETDPEEDEQLSEEEQQELSPFQKAYEEEVNEIKKSQEFLQMQQRRRELDKTWLDKGITAVIELFENIFRWEVID